MKKLDALFGLAVQTQHVLRSSLYYSVYSHRQTPPSTLLSATRHPSRPHPHPPTPPAQAHFRPPKRPRSRITEASKDRAHTHYTHARAHTHAPQLALDFQLRSRRNSEMPRRFTSHTLRMESMVVVRRRPLWNSLPSLTLVSALGGFTFQTSFTSSFILRV